MKTRIMSRARALDIMHADMFGGSGSSDYDQSKQAQFALMCYMIADGNTVKVYNDREMGGPVVETDE